MKKLTLSLFTLAISMWAADFWVAKPFTEWSEKDATKLTKSSPWAKEVTVTLGGPGGMAGGGGGASRGRGGGAGNSRNMGEAGGGAVTSTAPGGGGGGGGAGGMAGSGEMGSPNSRSAGMEGMSGMGGGAGSGGVLATFLWESATVVKQAKVKRKYGSEAGTSEAAKKQLEVESPTYVLSVGPLDPRLGRGGAQLKEMLIAATVLNVKGKAAIKPVQVEVIAQPTYSMLYFAFPKTTPLVAEDGEIEFVTKVGDATTKCKFDLKKMVVNGKLDM